ncbi:outer membrane protein assembly factor BamC [Halorhodospira halochloris]|nr:outer membrane protein assembly factor BamC [Halorhodospira halochloris]MCG5530670.1 outer membrane protein assembly factor BamC [Halorhodospira halochloris]
MLRLLPVVAAGLGLSLLVACGKEPMTREEAEYPDNLVIPPSLIDEPERDVEVAERRPRSAEEEDRPDLPVDVEQTIPTRVQADGDALELRVDMALNQAWVDTGQALNRLDFTILERERDDLRYEIRYAPSSEEEVEQPGFFARVFGGAERVETSPQRYTIELEQRASGVALRVKDRQGQPAPREVSERLLTLIDRELH